MKTRLKIILIALTIITAMTNLNGVAEAATKIQRLGGQNRYSTCKNIIENGWKTSKYAVIATGSLFPDALSSAVIAKKYNAPLILTPSNKLDSNAKDELKKLGVNTVFIIGGTGAVSSSVKDEIEKMNIQTVRIAGDDRFETSVKVAENLDTKNGIFVTTGMDFADALSVSPIAASKGMPIILVNKDNIDKSVLNYIKKRNITKTYVIGGTGVISDTVAEHFPNVERITGKTRYETNIELLNKFKSDIDMDNLYIATGLDYPDALAGAVLAGMGASSIVLTQDNLNENTYKFLNSNLNKVKCVKILGGTAVVHDSLINKLVKDKDTDDNSNKDTDNSEFKVDVIE